VVFFLTLPDGAGHIRLFVERFGRKVGRNLVEMTYGQLLQRGSAPPGVYIFTDQQVMNPSQKLIAAWIRSQLEKSPATHRALNDPENQLGRYELLQRLHESGQIQYRVFRYGDWVPAGHKFPVFVRIEDDHMGPRSELLGSVDDVVHAANRLILAGFAMQRILVVEFVDTRSSDGLYRKYGAFRIGDRIICQHILHSPAWLSKRETTIRTPDLVDQSDLYFTENPHADRLMHYFELARMDYGRIDYGMTDDTIHVWEINDNPTYVGRGGQRLSKVSKGEVFSDAFDELSVGLQPGSAIALAASYSDSIRWVAAT
jgi:hypothetical protein